MERRGFLAALIGLAATPVLDKLGFIKAPPTLAGPVLDTLSTHEILQTVEGLGEILQINAKTTRSGTLQVVDSLAREVFVASLYADWEHHTVWVPDPSMGVEFTKERPLVLETPPGAETSVLYRLKGSQAVYCLSLKDGQQTNIPLNVT